MYEKRLDKLQVYNYICEYYQENLFFPSYRNISENLYIGISVVARKLYQLERMGLIIQQGEGQGWRLKAEKIFELSAKKLGYNKCY